MVAFNKLLNVFVFALAIATLYFAITLKEQRKVITSQRLELAQALNQISKTIGNEVATSVLNTGLEAAKDTVEGKAAKAAKDESLAKVVSLSEGVVTQKDNLASCVVNMGQTLGIAESKLNLSGLKGLDKEETDNQMEVVNTAVTAVADRTTAVNKAVLTWSEALGKPLNRTDLSSVDNYEESLTVVGDTLTEFNERHAKFISSLQETMGKIEEFEWSFSPAEFAITDRYEAAFTSMQKDLTAINTELVKVTELTETVEAKNVEISTLTETVETRDSSIIKLGVELTDLGTMKIKLEEQLKNYTSVAGFDPNVVGTIIGVNPKFGFVVTSLNKKETGIGQKMFIRRGDKYIGSVEVRSLTEERSLADILVGSEKIEVGDVIFFKASK